MHRTERLLRQEISGRQAWRYAEAIAQYNRIQASPGYREAARKVAGLLAREGVEVGIREFPAREGVRFLARPSFREWRCNGGELWLLGQDGSRRRLARYQEEEVSLVQRSAATPPEGVEAELVWVPDAENPDSYRGLDLRGKFALVRGNAMAVHSLAVEEHGAAGLVFDNLNSYPPLRTREDMPDAIQYTSFWWTGREKPAFGFCVPPRVGDELRALLARGPVRLFARVDAYLTDGALENVEYFIPGKQQQEVLLVAHLCHPYPGAQDNASGPAVLMEVMRVLHRLLDRGELEPPQLGIRFLLVPEMTGTFAWLDRYPHQAQATVAALNLDMVGAGQDMGGGPLCIEKPPLATPTFLHEYAFGILSAISREATSTTGSFAYSTCHFLAAPFSGGSDHYVLSDPTIGIPCPMVIQWPDRHYHTSLDRPRNLDPGMLKRVAFLAALYAWGLAAGSEESWVEFAYTYAAQAGARVVKALQGALQNAGLRSQWPQVLDFFLDYEARALEQLGAYAAVREFPRLADAATWAQIFLADSGALVRQWASRAAGGRDEVPLREALDPRRGAQVYARVYKGPVDLNAELTRLPRQKQREWRAFAKAQAPGVGYDTLLLYWLDGRRSVAEALEQVYFESEVWHPNYALRFLDLLAELELVRLVK
ncbi:MAG TPA: DUF4910 domain-containing protein [Bacillota bacterium]|nr:DUF4910 domain-containing protein [Bacillota bacterium]